MTTPTYDHWRDEILPSLRDWTPPTDERDECREWRERVELLTDQLTIMAAQNASLDIAVATVSKKADSVGRDVTGLSQENASLTRNTEVMTTEIEDAVTQSGVVHQHVTRTLEKLLAVLTLLNDANTAQTKQVDELRKENVRVGQDASLRVEQANANAHLAMSEAALAIHEAETRVGAIVADERTHSDMREQESAVQSSSLGQTMRVLRQKAEQVEKVTRMVTDMVRVQLQATAMAQQTEAQLGGVRQVLPSAANPMVSQKVQYELEQRLRSALTQGETLGRKLTQHQPLGEEPRPGAGPVIRPTGPGSER